MRKSVVFLSFCLVISNGADVPLVKTEQGVVEGQVLLSRGGREYYSFLQLPYGKAKRFEAPTNPDKYEGILKATDIGNVCAQSFWYTNEHKGIEDCLTLHVYTPELKSRFPVMVYFHPGGFTLGTANEFHEKYFMDEDMVLVMVNYRLGPFGFLSTGDDIIPGNYGLKDQSQAMKWVQINIAKFGGNPESVTIFGSSAGGASVNYHMFSNLSKGLFHAGVSQSGTALNPWAFSPYPANMARKFGKAMNCPTESSRGLLKCLQEKSTEEILEGMKATVEWGCDPFTPFGPVVEPNIPGAFLTAEPAQLLQTGKFARVPWMAGLVQDEGHQLQSAYILESSELGPDIKENWKRIFPITFQFNEIYYNFTAEAQNKMAEKIYEFYFNGKPIDKNTRQEFTDIYSDRLFNQGVKKALLQASEYTEVYPYIFTHNRGDYTLLKVFHIEGNYGVTHADDATFIFDNFFGEAPEFQIGSAAEQVSKNMVKLWVSFARDKKPTALWGSQKTWKPIKKTQDEHQIIQFYKIDADTQMVPEHFTKRVEFWDNILADAAEQSGISLESKTEL